MPLLISHGRTAARMESKVNILALECVFPKRVAECSSSNLLSRIVNLWINQSSVELTNRVLNKAFSERCYCFRGERGLFEIVSRFIVYLLPLCDGCGPLHGFLGASLT